MATNTIDVNQAASAAYDSIRNAVYTLPPEACIERLADHFREFSTQCANDTEDTMSTTSEPEESIDDASAAHLAAIVEANEEVRRRAAAHADAKEAASEARKLYDAAVHRLTSVISGGPERLPLFDGAGQQPETDESSWRDALVSELDIPNSLVNKLADALIMTVGQLEDLRAGEGLTSIDGIGQTKAETIEEALLEWLDEHRHEPKDDDAA